MSRAHPLAREAFLSACAAATLAALLAWLGPPGNDLAAHAYQRSLFLQDGFELWNNFWYAGRYSFITYSLLYYPLAAWFGIKLLAVATIATAALAFAVVLWREWGATARWSSRSFAVVWAGLVLSAAFPFALGAALALLGLWALQAGARGRFGLFAVLTLAASPLAFLLLAVVLAGVGIARRRERVRPLVPAVTVGLVGGIEVLLWRAFPAEGHFPFGTEQLAAACGFCVLGVALTWRVERARMLLTIFLVYFVVCLALYLVPSAVGANIARLRLVALPLTVLALSLRGWRPRWVAAAALALTVAWNVTPFVGNYASARSDPAADVAYWQPAIAFLRTHLTPSYRVEAVDTSGHWAAVYLPRAGIPLARGWFRQDDFPHNRLLYSRLGARAYVGWLRSLGVRYVVLSDAPPDYSARGEAALLRGGRSGMRAVLRTPHLTIFTVPRPQPIVTGPRAARVVALTESEIRISLAAPGQYRVAVRHSPYWSSEVACVEKAPDGMIGLTALRVGTVDLRFQVNAGRALATVAGRGGRNCPEN